MSAWVRPLVDTVASSILTVGFQQFAAYRILPVNPLIREQYSVFGLFLGLIGAIVASGAFGPRDRNFGLVSFGVTAFLAILTIVPFIASSYDITFGLRAEVFAVLAVVAYLFLHPVTGVLIGGGWTVIRKSAFAELLG